MSSFLNTISAVGALAMAATPLMAVGSLAHAAEIRPVHIQVADLDFSRNSDVAAFQARVERAADKVCRQAMSAPDLSAMTTCRAAVRDEAVAKLGADQRQAMQTASVRSALTVAAN